MDRHWFAVPRSGGITGLMQALDFYRLQAEPEIPGIALA
jgi:hypothetical protein